MARERREARLCRSTRTFGYTAAPRRAPTHVGTPLDTPPMPSAWPEIDAPQRDVSKPPPRCRPVCHQALLYSHSLSFSRVISLRFFFTLYVSLRAACFCSFLCSFAFLVRSVVFFFLFFCLRYSSLQWYVALSFSATFFHHTSIRFIL